jgi:hypothetical protein
MNIPTKFGSDWPCGFQRSRLKTDNTLFDTFRALVSFVSFQSRKKLLFRDHPINIPTKFGFN